MTYYPVIIPTLNRYQHFKECVESLAANKHADKTELVIGLDYPLAEKYVNGWKQIKEYIPTITGFAKITFFEHKHNLGAADNFSFLIDYTSKNYDAWIETEDDNIFSPCFLDYMNKCLDKYKFDNDIMYVCGCLEPEQDKLLNLKTNSNSSIIKVLGNASAYGIGVWKNKEIELCRQFPSNFQKYVFSSRTRIIKLLQCPSKLNHIYFWINNRPELNRICDFTRNAWMFLNNKKNVLPRVSLVRNNGFDGSGEHSGLNYEEINCWNNLELSKSLFYDVIDNESEKNIRKNSKRLFSSYPKSDLKAILPVVIIYLIFGYKLGNCILNLKNKKRK